MVFSEFPWIVTASALYGSNIIGTSVLLNLDFHFLCGARLKGTHGLLLG